MSTRFYPNQIDYITQLNLIDDSTLVANDVTNASTVYPVFSTTGAAGGLLRCATTKMSFVPSTGVLSITNLTLLGGYTIGDILYAGTTTTLSALPGVATGNALISGGVGVAPSWGKVGLTTHVTGVLGVANGGTGKSTNWTTWGVVYANATNTITNTAQGTAGQFLKANGAAAPTWSDLQTPDRTVSQLPAAAVGNRGMRAHVTDSTVAAAGNYGATVAGGGTNVVPVFSTGTAWIIA